MTVYTKLFTPSKLADSGAYHDYTDIEYVLRFDYGLSDVSALLDGQLMHRDLNRR